MKKPVIFTLLCLILQVGSAFAQNDGEQPTVSTDTAAAETNDSVEVVIAPKKGQDSTIVRIGDMKIIVLNGMDSDQGNNEVIIDYLEDDSTEVKHSSIIGGKTVHHWAGFRIGIDGFLHDDGLAMPATADFMELDYARSIGVSFNLIERDFRLYRNYIELVTGLGFNITNYTFESDFATIQNTNPITAVLDSSRVLERNRLKIFYLTAPLMLGFSTSEDQSKAFRLAAGGQVSWRVGSRLKQKYTENGETVKPKVKSDYNLNPFIFSAVASVGYGPINVYANYGLNTLFEDGKGPELTPFNVGMQLMF